MKYKKGDIIFALDASGKSYAMRDERLIRENLKRGVIVSEYEVSVYTAYEPGRSYNTQSCQIMMDSGTLRSFYGTELDYFQRIMHESNACNMKK